MNDKKLIRVRDVMKSQFDTVDGMATVAEILNTMMHVETKTVIVRKRHDDDEYGTFYDTISSTSPVSVLISTSLT